MFAKDFITKEIPVLNLFDSSHYALSLMEDFKLKHLPLVADNVYLQLVAEKDLLISSDDLQMKNLNFVMSPVYVSPDAHVLEVVSLMTRHGLSLVPVVEEKQYRGVVLRDRVVDVLSEMTGAESTGSIIMLELVKEDYSISDISRIVESNRAHILSLLSRMCNEKIYISLKLDLEDPSPVIRSFERFNYSVLSYSVGNNIIDEQFQQRMNEVLYYMNL